MINQVFHNQLLCRYILQHVSGIYSRLNKSTIKGGVLHSSGDLMMMLKFNAISMFIESFDSVANNYPYNTTLLKKCAAQYNNTRAFNHLIKHPNIIIDQTVFKLEHVCQHGNIDILQSYIDATSCYSTHCIDFVECIPLAIDNGNEHFVRLLLQRLSVRGSVPRDNTEISEGDNSDNERYDEAIKRLNKYKFKCHGISIDVLRVLNEEFSCLFVFGNIWSDVLARSAKFDMVDSVQYILSNLGQRMKNVHPYYFGPFMKQVAKAGNVELFRMFTECHHCDAYFRASNVKDIIIKMAAEYGQEALVLQLYDLCIVRGVYPMPESAFAPYLEGPPHAKRLRITPLAAILNDDLMYIDAMLSSINSLDLKMCRSMSTSIAMLITSQRSPAPVFDGQSLSNMVLAINKPGSNITVDLACKFIDHCTFNEHDEFKVWIAKKSALEEAAGFSAALMARIYRLLNDFYDEGLFMAKALASRCRETIEYGTKNKLKLVKLDAFKFFEKASMDDVRFVSKLLDSKIMTDPVICEWAVLNQSSEVFEYIINLFTMDELKTNLQDIVEFAMIYGNPQHIQSLQRHFGVQHDLYIGLSLETLESIVSDNHYSSLEFHFNSTAFNKQTNKHQLRTLHSILNKAYQVGSTRLMKLCINHIDSLNQPDESNEGDEEDYEEEDAEYDDDDDNDDEDCDHPVPELDQAFHLVIGDARLATMIMRQIGMIHSSLGIDLDRLIKGSTLLANNNLLHYIRFGATEYFIKSYYTIKDQYQYPHNTTLLSEAFANCNTRALVALLDNPNMSLPTDRVALENILRGISRCPPPYWEWIFEQYLKIVWPTDTPFVMTEDFFLSVHHVAFLQKLIQMGFSLDRTDDYKIIYDRLANSWFTKPWALETVQFLHDHSLLEKSFQKGLLYRAIEHNVLDVFGHIISINPEFQQLDAWIDLKRGLLDHCCKFGRANHLDIFLALPFNDIITRGVFLIEAVSGGHLDIVRRLVHDIGLTNPGRIANKIFEAIPFALNHGHLDIFDYLISLEYQRPQPRRVKTAMANKSMIIEVDSISDNIISIELIERLKSCGPYTIKLNSYRISKHALDRAMTVGYVSMARTLLDMYPHVALDKSHHLTYVPELIKSIGTPGSQATEDTISEFYLKLKDSVGSTLRDMMLGAATKSLSMIQWVITHFTSAQYNESVDRLTCSDFQYTIDRCAKRCDVQAIDYLIDLAIGVCKRTDAVYGWDQQRIQDIISLDEINNTTVLTYLLDKGYMSVDNVKSSALPIIVNKVCVEGDVDILRMIHQRCVTASQLQRHLPSMSSIQNAVINNHHKLITYMFEGDSTHDGSGSSLSPYVRAKVDQMNITKLLRTVRHHAFVNGCLNIINMCDRLI
ncbi:hypothetical protein SAMD00019534_041460 [Acytostelium subglobosum LB1]|uniref:hypothetical protein n=1 Tax=Acytostelium subglobosum LB1 TaxID=1410327 RepID=UPI000644F69C|nr:hypothetical protein SAMD00019534_041460 [Acytostelium subglobosum LB1]GAM20971.1 hypothetical protein SAMD00019534_041460 [Acytostelium subglobosum LB1]|eukprot:XP_012756105.1 hypothetical protein SAMD00019534_041460 [Acytostelium subglobosum LB1]